MKLNHEKIKEMLPEYLRGSLSEELKKDVKAHLKKCHECKEEIFYLSELIKIDVPEPGDLFYKTLPQRVKGSLKDESERRFSLRSIFFRPILAATAAVFIALIIFTFTRNGKIKEFDPFFKDPFTASVLDYSDIDISERDIVSKDLAIDERYIHEDFMGYSYVREFAYLDSNEIDGLYEALKKEQKIGG
ncbi:MAG: zf-HC2 domain-containing protein [Nitrospirae bacterium]|nr:zf-HC2 domain-containing protein [Nitrospirota bacterium]